VVLGGGWPRDLFSWTTFEGRVAAAIGMIVSTRTLVSQILLAALMNEEVQKERGGGGE
jgi:hypothetical protein